MHFCLQFLHVPMMQVLRCSVVAVSSTGVAIRVVSDTLERGNDVHFILHFWLVLVMQVLRCSVGCGKECKGSESCQVSDIVERRNVLNLLTHFWQMLMMQVL